MRLRLKQMDGLPRTTRLLLFLCSLLIIGQGVFTAYIYANAQRRVSQQLSTGFQDLTSESIDDLTHHIETYSDLLYSARGLFASARVDATAWDTFIRAQSAAERYAGMQTIAYAETVADGQIGAYERSLQTTQDDTITIHPRNDRSQHVILTYLKEIGISEPRLKDLLGYDMTASPERLAILERARSTGTITSSSRIEMVPIGNAGFLLVMPLSERFGSQTADSPAFGYVIAAFNIEKFITSTIGPRLDRHHTSLMIKDMTDAQHPVLMDRRVAASGDIVTQVATMRVGDRTWEMTFTTPKSSLLLPAQRYAPSVALALGTAFIVATCIGSYALRLRGRLKESVR